MDERLEKLQRQIVELDARYKQINDDQVAAIQRFEALESEMIKARSKRDAEYKMCLKAGTDADLDDDEDDIKIDFDPMMVGVKELKDKFVLISDHSDLLVLEATDDMMGLNMDPIEKDPR